MRIFGGQHRAVQSGEYSAVYNRMPMSASIDLPDQRALGGELCEDGMLFMGLQNVIPKEKKPCKVRIGGDAKSLV